MDLRTAAKYLCISPRVIEDWLKDQIIQSIGMPGSSIRDKSGNIVAHAKNRKIVKHLILREDLDALIDQRKAGAQ